jgi:hypothetical protein
MKCTLPEELAVIPDRGFYLDLEGLFISLLELGFKPT